jgi:hypothetical protein
MNIISSLKIYIKSFNLGIIVKMLWTKLTDFLLHLF